MKRFITFLAIVALPLVSYAFSNVNVDGLVYRVYTSYDEGPKRAEVVENYRTKYSGDIVIQSSIQYFKEDYPVTGISERAFWDCPDITSITIPETITSIEKLAFGGNSGLNRITVAAGNQYYDSRENCNCIIETATNKLIAGCNTSFIPTSVTSIESNAFYGSMLTKIDIPDSITEIAEYTFANCKNLKEVSIGESVTIIGKEAFWKCSSLAQLKIGNSVKRIEFYAFYNCASLTSLVIPNSVTFVGDYSFDKCSGLKEVELGNSVEHIQWGAFCECENLKSINIPNSVIFIDQYAFMACM